MAEGDSFQQLPHEAFDGDGVQGASIASGVHVLLQIFVHELKDQHELVLGVDDIVEGDNVFVFELLHKRYLSNGGTGSALFGVEVDFFQGNELARLAIAAFEDLWVC